MRIKRAVGIVLLSVSPLALAGCGASQDGPLGGQEGDGSSTTVCSPGNVTETAIFGFPLTNSHSDQPVWILDAEVTHSRRVRPDSAKITFDPTPNEDDTWIGGDYLSSSADPDVESRERLDSVFAKMVDPPGAIFQPGQEVNMLVFFSAEKDPVTSRQMKTAVIDEITIRYRVGGRDYKKIVRLEMQIKPDEC